MKRFKLLMAMLVSVVLFAGCSATSNLTQNVNLTQTNVVLLRIVKNVSSEVSATYVFGIGGMSYKALRENAVANLTKEANLTGSQALINVTVESTTQFALIWTKTTFKAYGTVIEFM